MFASAPNKWDFLNIISLECNMKKLIIIAAFALSLSGCLHWWGYRDQPNDRRDDQRQEQHNNHQDNQDHRQSR